MRRAIIASVLALTLASGYAAADVLDIAPGILTRDRVTPLPASATPGSGATASLVPLPVSAASPAPVLPALGDSAPMPSRVGLDRVLGAALTAPALGPGVGISVTDARTGASLYAAGTDTPRTVASAQKLLTAAVLTTTLDLDAVMTTMVVRSGPAQLTLVAGGDTLLARGAGDPDSPAGHAGLADLAAQVASALAKDPAPAGEEVTLTLDATYAAGDRYPPGWNPADISAGFTSAVSMLGLAAQRPKPYEPSPADPAGATLQAFADQLGKAGVEVTVADSAKQRAQAAPSGAAVLGKVESAPYRDVLAEALDTSDNALTENLARQAAVRKGGDGSFAASAAFVTDGLRRLGLDLTGVHLLDTSGLTRGQTATVAILTRVLRMARDGKLPGLADQLARLPVAGLDGATLHDRFLQPPANSAAGIARAKTGTLTGISSLVGHTVDADGREFDFVIVADQVPAASGTWAARAALDRIVADLTGCGCR